MPGQVGLCRPCEGVGFILNTLGNISLTLLTSNSVLLPDCFLGKDLKDNAAALIFFGENCEI